MKLYHTTPRREFSCHPWAITTLLMLLKFLDIHTHTSTVLTFFSMCCFNGMEFARQTPVQIPNAIEEYSIHVWSDKKCIRATAAHCTCSHSWRVVFGVMRSDLDFFPLSRYKLQQIFVAMLALFDRSLTFLWFRRISFMPEFVRRHLSFLLQYYYYFFFRGKQFIFCRQLMVQIEIWISLSSHFLFDGETLSNRCTCKIYPIFKR